LSRAGHNLVARGLGTGGGHQTPFWLAHPYVTIVGYPDIGPRGLAQSQKPPFSRLLARKPAGLANLLKSCCNTCLEIIVSKPLIRVEF